MLSKQFSDTLIRRTHSFGQLQLSLEMVAGWLLPVVALRGKWPPVWGKIGDRRDVETPLKRLTPGIIVIKSEGGRFKPQGQDHVSPMKSMLKLLQLSLRLLFSRSSDSEHLFT